MPVKRKQYSADQKAKIALTAIKGQQTVNEIAGDFGVHPTQVAQWKKQLLDEAPQVFASGRDRKAASRKVTLDAATRPLNSMAQSSAH